MYLNDVNSILATFAIVMITGVLLHLARIMKTCPKCKKNTFRVGQRWAKMGHVGPKQPPGTPGIPKKFQVFPQLV